MATPKQQPMCAVTIGFETYLMPAAAGMKVVALMQQSLTTEATYGISRDSYVAGDTPRITYQAVKPSQIDMPAGADVSPARSSTKQLGQKPLRLTRKD